jgi:transcription-repair coupling factor (superfamily II helicase)
VDDPSIVQNLSLRLISSVPEGLDAYWLARRFAAGGPRVRLHVARDDARMEQIADCFGFFAPEVAVETFPAWDCLPYDRVGPRLDILAQRADLLSRLSSEPTQEPPSRLIVTTINALLQRVPPGAAFAGLRRQVSPGSAADPTEVVAHLAACGYQRVETVSEPGEYAPRGGIIDFFPPQSPDPLRLDFFGDELESIRCFDPVSQRTSAEVESAVIGPVGEVFLTAETIEGFRSGYREAFGGGRDDPLYESVSAGRHHQGMEHWLPLFHERLETLCAYLPASIGLTLDHQVMEAAEARFETIDDFFEARRLHSHAGAETGETYRPLDPSRLYLTRDDWTRTLEALAAAQFTPFAVPGGGAEEGGGRPGVDFADVRGDPNGNLFDAVKDRLSALVGRGQRVVIAAYSTGALERLRSLLSDHGMSELGSIADWPQVDELPPSQVALARLPIERGFSFDGVTLVTEQDILGERLTRPSATRRRAENFLTEVSALAEGDFVVHVEHGIGRYDGLVALDVGGAPHDCLMVIYHGGDKLYVPVENIEVLSRYGSEESAAELDRLGGANWQARKARVKQRLKDMAAELIKIAAARELKSVDRIEAPEGLYAEFAARFPFAETEDQQRAIEDTLADLTTGRPMDRLICGDVGFGKTEVALRAAFLTVMSGRQVAIVVPTTLLARQHHRTFADRFRGLPVEVRQLSRLVANRAQSETRANLAAGKVNIVIGTHTLLSKSVSFRDLGLVIVDEEQHFGVKQKERLKALRQEVHVLTLTATPIPRTLQLAMSGVKEMSLIASPPVDRLAVRTFVLPYDPVIVREAIMREHFRGGQVFVVCPRIQDLGELAERMAKLVPEVKIGVAHGQLPARDLEAVMTGFYDRRFDLLLSTNIIESGLDIPTANTLIVHRADMFGLSQLYQLRGRIGRAKVRGYAYFTLPTGKILTPAAEKRLQVMQTLDNLGAGFQLASHDLDIRGAPNLLGEEQSGHIREVGIELYQQMLEEAVATARGGAAVEPSEATSEEAFTPQISLGTPVLIPESYVRELNVRLGLYRRLSSLVDRQEIEAFAAELIDRFGPLPEEVENLLEVMAIKRLCRDAGVERLDAGPKGAVVAFHQDSFARPEALVPFIQNQAGQIKLRPDMKLVYRRTWDDPAQRMRGVRHFLGELAKLAQPPEQPGAQ